MASARIGNLELIMLLTVARLGDDAYGLAVRRDVAQRTGREYSVGAIYTTLERLQEKGLVTSRTTDPLPSRGGRTRRAFTVSGAGKRTIREAERMAKSMWAGIGDPIRPRHA